MWVFEYMHLNPITNNPYARIVFLLLLLYGVSGCTNLIFQPTRTLYPLPPQLNIHYEDIFFPSTDGTQLHGWFLPAKVKPKQTLLFLHGNALNISSQVAAVFWLVDYGYDVYIFDYRGYGRSGGEVSLPGAINDIDAAIKFVSSNKRVNDKLILFGQSLGASMGIYVLSQSEKKDDIAAYISLAAFSDYHEIAQDFISRHWFTWAFQWPLSYTVNNDYRPLNYIADISPVPIYILHGINDHTIEIKHAESLFSAARQPKYFIVLENGHNTIFQSQNNRNKFVEILDNLRQH